MIKKSIKEQFDKTEFLRHSMRLIFIGLNDVEIAEKVTQFLMENATAEGQKVFVELEQRIAAENKAMEEINGTKPSDITG